LDILEFQTYIEEKIPLVRKAGFRILELSDQRVIAGGDFSENRNHHNTVFGGSISVILILASWALVQEIMHREDPDASIVIARQTINYFRPAKADFTGECHAPDSDLVDQFIRSYHEKGSGRIEVTAELKQKDSDRPCARFTGEFHASRMAQKDSIQEAE